MYVSIFEMFSIGLGPSSSHTIGPMKCAYDFIQKYALSFKDANQIYVNLYGSLALTGKGHNTDKAVILGLLGHTPEAIDPALADELFEQCKRDKTLQIDGKTFDFAYDKNLLFHYTKCLPYHANGIIFTLKKDGEEIKSQDYYSIGGGFFVHGADAPSELETDEQNIAHHFDNAHELIELASQENKTIATLLFENELCLRSESEIKEGILHIWQVMNSCIQNGLNAQGILPGGLEVKKRAYNLHQKMLQKKESTQDRSELVDWLSVYSMAVNEENASGGKVVTAPTNGAAGIIPAVLKYHLEFFAHDIADQEECILTFLLTACAIGGLYKKNASISAAEVGCQGEVGVACSMAAGALCAVKGGSLWQIENAAEIGMEHHLGLTCDPIGGLVQIPCIERNAVGANNAITACRLALMGDGSHHIGLDSIIETMFQTGKEMSSKYKETSQAGLANAKMRVSSISC